MISGYLIMGIDDVKAAMKKHNFWVLRNSYFHSNFALGNEPLTCPWGEDSRRVGEGLDNKLKKRCQ